MGHRGFLEPRPTPLTIVRGFWAIIKELWAAKTVASRATIGCLLGLLFGAAASLFAWWFCKEPFPFTGVSHQGLWETVSCTQLFFWGHRGWDADHCTVGDVFVLLVTNGLLLGLLGSLMGCYVGRLGNLREPSQAGGREAVAGRTVTPTRRYWATILLQARWGFCVGIGLAALAFGTFLLNAQTGTLSGEEALGYWYLLTSPA